MFLEVAVPGIVVVLEVPVPGIVVVIIMAVPGIVVVLHGEPGEERCLHLHPALHRLPAAPVQLLQGDSQAHTGLESSAVIFLRCQNLPS